MEPVLAITSSGSIRHPHPTRERLEPRAACAGNTLQGVTSPRQLAVIDLGSNSFRLVVFAASSDWWKRVGTLHPDYHIVPDQMPDEPERVAKWKQLFQWFRTRPALGTPYRRLDPVSPGHPAVPDEAPAALRLPIVSVS